MKNRLLFFTLLVAFIKGHAQEQQEQTNDSIPKITLEEVTVAGIRAQENAPIPLSNVTQEAIASRNLGQDIPILLNYLPSVVTTSDAGMGVGYTGIRVRGSDATRVNVTINGIPYNDAESHQTYWVNLPDFASSVASFQLQRGVGTSTNGAAAFGASLNLLTDEISDKPYAEVASSAGSFQTFKNTVKFSTGLLKERVELAGRFSKITSDGYVDRATSNLESYFLQAAYRDENTLIKVLGFGGHEITYQSWYGVDKATLEENRTYNPAGIRYDDAGNFEDFYDRQVDDYRQDHLQAHWSQHINAHWNFSVGFNYTYGRGFYEEYNDLWNVQNVTFGDEVNYLYLQLTPYLIGDQLINTTENITRKWLDNDFWVGRFNVQWQDQNKQIDVGGMFSNYTGSHFGVLEWGEQLPDDVSAGHRFYTNLGEKDEINLFAKARMNVSSKTTAYADLQYRNINYKVLGVLAGPALFIAGNTFHFFNPKAGITHQLNAQHQLYFSYAKAQREPNRTDYENGDPKPEILDDFELGWRWKNEQLEWQTNLYWMAYKEQLVLTGAIDEEGSPIRQNVGKSRRIGIEMEGKVKLSDQWIWQPNIALSKNQNMDFYTQRDGDFVALGNTNLAFSPEVVAGNALLFIPSTDFQMALLSKYVGQQFMGNIDSETSVLEAYSVTDFNVTYAMHPSAIFKEIKFSLLVNNIFNKQYVSNGYFYTYDDINSDTGETTTIEGAGYYPQAGTHFFAGVLLSF